MFAATVKKWKKIAKFTAEKMRRQIGAFFIGKSMNRLNGLHTDLTIDGGEDNREVLPLIYSGKEAYNE